MHREVPMTERVLIMRHASGLVNRARRVAIEKWPTARLEVHDLAAYGKPPADFRWASDRVQS